MNNPFATLEARLVNIESLLLDLKHPPQKPASHLPEKELFTVQQTANFLTLSVPTIYGLIHKGEIPNMKQGNRCYFLKSDLMAYLEKGRRKSKDEVKKEVTKRIEKFNTVKR